MRHFSLLALTAVTVIAVGSTASAQGPKAGKGPAVTAHASNGGSKASAGGSKAPTGSVKPTGSGRPTSGPSSAKGGGSASGNTAKGSGMGDGGSKRPGTTSTSGESTTTSTTTGTGTTADGTATTVVEPNPISTKIAKNPNQLARLQAMLPAGMTIEEASAGFRNQGQFIAAVNASKNRGIPFVDLKEAMTVDGLSLGQAAKKLQAAPPEASTLPATGDSTTGTSTSTGAGTTTSPAAQ